MNINDKTIYVVGDKFQAFSKNPNVMSISALEKRITELNSTDLFDCIYKIYIGQGIDFNRVALLRKSISAQNLEKIYQVKMADHFKASQLTTHKYKLENIMISDPEQCEAGKFSSILMLDDNCAEMSDHVTGQHLQGMVLIEAARQMTLAVTEKFYLNKDVRTKMSFVTDSLSTSFKSYLFPLEVELVCSINHITGHHNNKKFIATLNFIQNGKICTEVKYNFTVFTLGFVVQENNNFALNAVSMDLAA